MKELKDILNKKINIKTIYLVGVSVVSLLLIVLCFSYAIFTTAVEKNGVLNIIAGNLHPSLVSEELDSNNQIAVESGEIKTFDLKIQNINTVDVKANLYYEVVEGDSSLVDIGYIEETTDLPPGSEGYVIEKYGENNEKVITMGINNKSESEATIEFGMDVGLSNVDLELTGEQKELVLIELPGANEFILAVYQYDQINADTLCITGEEATCIELNPDDIETYEMGTIVNYQVNDNENYYFYVLHDDEDKLTMQQRENTLLSSYAPGTASGGPTKAIPGLETETADWSNVLDQTYTMGTTVFGPVENAFTSCDTYNTCTTNKYAWIERTGKARMITVQEGALVGCTATRKSCPVWMYNYLALSTNYGGTVNSNNTDSAYYSYWTMSGKSGSIWIINQFGWLTTTYDSSYSSPYGVRAVVQISK